ncbi:uncharacterized protein At2g27730, mitochondrial-like [Curcuma longa]|uniref:uncharacterized protein At2g27730, mitochondrial-like n=1 Tax=Curcuma longa TaxID=136217 RepID=UPI003D9E408E
MAARVAARYVARRLSSGGKVLTEEEKAAENVYIKKIEKEKLEKLAHKGPKPAEEAPAKPEPSSTDVKSTMHTRDRCCYQQRVPQPKPKKTEAVLAATAAAVCGLGWYLLSKPKKTEEVVLWKCGFKRLSPWGIGFYYLPYFSIKLALHLRCNWK